MCLFLNDHFPEQISKRSLINYLKTLTDRRHSYYLMNKEPANFIYETIRINTE